jgi:hypothetical protein
MKNLVLSTVLLFIYTLAFSQVYVEGGKTRHRFAQLTLGMDVRTFLAANSQESFFNTSGAIENKNIGTETESRILIGGTHFWGHSDFYIGFPVASFTKTNFKSGVELGAKVFPLRIENKKIRAYAGVAWQSSTYQQAAGTRHQKSALLLSSGLVYNRKNMLVEMGGGFMPNKAFDYYISTTEKAKIHTQNLYFSLSCKWFFDMTLSAEKDWISGKTKIVTDTLAKRKKLNGFTLAVGPSSTTFLKQSSYNNETLPFLGNHKSAKTFADFGLGYYLHKADVQFNIAYRNIHSTLNAYNYTQSLQRRAISAEAFAFISDYHGFALFVGPVLSVDRLTTTLQSPDNKPLTLSKNSIEPGLIFGWDIRPNRLQVFYLRTNLRWFPRMNMPMPNQQKIAFEQLEFNFIQLVIFPERLFK